MYRTIKTALVAILVLGSSSLVRADDGTDAALDTSRTGSPYQQVLTTKPVAMPQAQVGDANKWMERASQGFGGGF